MREALRDRRPAIGHTPSVIGVYVHIPFCHHRCTYCDFNIYAGMRSLYERYARAVAQELALAGLSPRKQMREDRRPRQLPSLHTSVPLGEQNRAATVYFGGGTPSLLPIACIELILDAIRSSFDVPPDVEITLEANPRPDDDGYFARLRELGVNRISLGVQSAHARDLHLFRRGHTFEDVARTCNIVRAAGFDNLNLDLIYGIPGQSLDDWRVTLEAARSLGPEHISAYGLQVEDGTTLKKWIAQGKVPSPDDDLAADMYNLAEELLEAAGFAHYEISNWARATPTLRAEPQGEASNLHARFAGSPTSNLQPPTSKCRHNSIYWRNEPYLGYGCGAHSWFGGQRFSNVRHPREYIQRIEAGQGVAAESESISRELEMGETMMVGLRLLEEGVTFERFGSRFGIDMREVYHSQMEQLSKQGLIEADEARLRLSHQGRLVGNRVFREFLPASNLHRAT